MTAALFFFGWVVIFLLLGLAEALNGARAIRDWLELQGLPRLTVQAHKDYQMWELWDDRAVQVIKNTGDRADGQPD